VHGNETSSSEAAMLTLYEILNPANKATKDWLKDMVIIIDPCINPDGRDRYVNWYNSVVGKSADPQPYTREHREPWPGGRTNHYYFDLNRDWAWQTQIESRQRLVKYNMWLPQVHVDFHEQSYNDPYYFAPAAEPYHEVITNWQRDFQQLIGKNNARYFDEKGWLYFTKERFDLFYPSYGDTYPTYKGSIGMTFEQGGGSRSGSAVVIEDGDTLTLQDRMMHHFTTGMSVLEVSAQNADRLLSEFRSYFQKAVNNPAGEFKSYLVRATEGDQLKSLTGLLDRNMIDWSYVPARNITGLNYRTGKTETFKSEGADIVVNANQPNSNLVRVLFERNSKLSDSATYDITAWSIPYVYGLPTYGLSTVIPGNVKTLSVSKSDVSNSPTNSYAYAIRWNGMNSARFLAEVLKQRIRVRFASETFSVGGKQFERGSLLITRAANQSAGNNLEAIIRKAATSAEISYTPVATGFVEKGFDLGSESVRVMSTPRVAVLAGEQVSSLAMGEVWNFFDNQLQYPLSIMLADDINLATLGKVDVLIMADGNYKMLDDRVSSDMLKNWVQAGGKIIAMENAVQQLAKGDWGFHKKSEEEKPEDKKAEPKVDYSLLEKYGDRERSELSNSSIGSIFRVELDNTHPLAYGYGSEYFTLKTDAGIYDFIRDNGWNVGIIRKNAYVSGFTGTKAKEKLKDGMLFGVLELGKGTVVLMADNPIFRNFWENGKLLFCNAVFMVGQ
jgi:hypothetical protein